MAQQHGAAATRHWIKEDYDRSRKNVGANVRDVRGSGRFPAEVRSRTGLDVAWLGTLEPESCEGKASGQSG